MRSTLAALVTTLTLFAGPAVAGVADTSLPELLVGANTYHLYTVPSVMHGFGTATYFGCTSLEQTASMQVGVEIFPGNGGAPSNNVVATSINIPPGATRIFGTSFAAGMVINSNVGGTPGFSGSARILATSKKLSCTAFAADTGNAPPTSMMHLTIIAKTKQKAAN